MRVQVLRVARSLIRCWPLHVHHRPFLLHHHAHTPTPLLQQTIILDSATRTSTSTTVHSYSTITRARQHHSCSKLSSWTPPCVDPRPPRAFGSEPPQWPHQWRSEVQATSPLTRMRARPIGLSTFRVGMGGQPMACPAAAPTTLARPQAHAGGNPAWFQAGPYAGGRARPWPGARGFPRANRKDRHLSITIHDNNFFLVHCLQHL